MQLKNLEISLNEWGDNKGKYNARIKYMDPTGEVHLILSPDVSGELLKAVGPMLNRYSLNGMADLQQAIQNAITEVKP